MIKIGNFFFRYRNILFIFLYLLLFVPSPDLFSARLFGAQYWVWPVIAGLLITISGQAIRGATIGLAYIVRGGKEGKVYAEDLVTTGIFNHCRNPLYVGNVLMLFGVGVLANSFIYTFVVMPVFFFIYQAIVLAEEHYLRSKFGESFNAYCKRVSRWTPNFTRLGSTFRSMEFKWKRWILKEYNTQLVWLVGITLILLIKYPQLTDFDESLRNTLLAIILPILGIAYLFVRWLKKSKRMVE